MPNDIFFIGNGTFYFCKNSKTINLSTKLKKLNSLTFLHCSSLTLINIPASVEEVNIAKENKNFCVEEKTLFNKLTEFNKRNLL